MAGYAKLIRVWRGSARRKVCRGCQRPFLLVIDDRGKYLPFALDAKSIDTVQTDRGTFDVYDPATAFHPCPAKKPRTRPQPLARQESLL